MRIKIYFFSLLYIRNERKEHKFSRQKKSKTQLLQKLKSISDR